MSRPIAALYVETNGCYYGLPDVDPWDRERDARGYAGPNPVVAHPPCERWGRYWGGVLEHPEGSHAWRHFGLNTPPRTGRWISAGLFDPGWTCCVEQGAYGHRARKATWLYAFGIDLPELDWSLGEQRIPQWMIDRYGYEKARRIGVVAMVGGKDKTRIRNATPEPFRDLLIGMARSVYSQRIAA